MAATLLRLCVCTAALLLYGSANAAPVNPLLRPVLAVVGVGGARSLKEISKLLKELKCAHDNQFDMAYSEAGRLWLPQFNSPSKEFADLYNGNIELLWLISNHGWMKEMCDERVLKDLSSFEFCSIIDTEEHLEEAFILEMNETVTTLGLLDILRFAGDLQKLKGKEDCMRVCGGQFVSNMLCSAFTEMSVFIIDQMIMGYTQPSQQTASDNHNVQNSAQNEKLTPGNTEKISPSIGSSGRPAANSGSPKGVGPSATTDPPPATTPAAAGVSPSISEEMLQSAFEKFFSKKLGKDPSALLQILSQFNFNAPTGLTHDSGHETGTNVGNNVPDSGNINPFTTQQNREPISSVQDTNSRLSDWTLEPHVEEEEEEIEGEATEDGISEENGLDGDEIENDIMGEDDGDDGETKEGDVSLGPEDGLAPDEVDGEGDSLEPVQKVVASTVAPMDTDNKNGETEQQTEQQGVASTVAPMDTDNKNGEAEQQTEQQEQALNPAVLNGESQGFEEEEEEEEVKGGGYRSIHFFGILLVLSIFTIVAYLCVYHKKKIKETMKDYVSDSQIRRSRTRGYKPLLSGKK